MTEASVRRTPSHPLQVESTPVARLSTPAQAFAIGRLLEVMRALTWQSTGTVSVEEVPDPRIEEPTDAIIRITSSAICGSDLHLYNVLGAFLDKGDVLGHEPMGIVEEIGSGRHVTRRRGSRGHPVRDRLR